MIVKDLGNLYTVSSTTTASSGAMGKNDFLKLLVTQLQNQDPLNPMDNTEFTAQLAQFSSLEELQNINSSIQTLHLSQKAIHNTQALALIGKSVVAPGDQITLAAAGADPLYFNLEADAAEATVHIYDAAGNLVASKDQGALEAGSHAFAWDGTDDSGALLEEGTYSVVVLATGADGKDVATKTSVAGTVERVVFDGTSPRLVIGDRQIDFYNIDQAEDGSQTTASAK